MRKGAGAAVAVFTGVLALAGGVGWLLYEAGKSEETSADGAGGGRTSATKKGRPSKAVVEVVPPSPVVKAKPPTTPNARFPVPGHDDLKLRNWREIAIVYTEMNDSQREIARDGPPDPMNPKDGDRLEKRAALTQRFQAYLMDTPEGFAPPLPNRDPNVPPPVVTPTQHPAFVVNLIAALLDRSSAPLTDEQSRRLLDVALKHSALADRPAPQASPDDWALERAAAKAQAADDFYGDLFGALTHEQGEIVAPSADRDHAGMAALSSALAWSQMLRAMPFTDIDKLVDDVTDCLATSFNIPDRAADLRPIVDKWARASAFDAGDTDETARGAVRTFRGPAAVKSMIALLRSVLDELKPPPPDIGRVRGIPVALVPLRK